MKARPSFPARLFAAALLCAAATLPVRAGEANRPLGVVELFTSQGCNSCPPADRVFTDLADREDVIALAWHVDYWDYLGWKDTLASNDNTQRQSDYAKAFNIRSVYTPQAVISGRTHVNGAKAGKVEAALRDPAGALSVDVSIRREGDRIVVEAGSGDLGIGEARLLLVYVDPRRDVEIQRGENAGQKLAYRNAVLSSHLAGMWHGKPMRFELPVSEMTKRKAASIAALVQLVGADGVPGRIIGAAMLKPASS